MLFQLPFSTAAAISGRLEQEIRGYFSILPPATSIFLLLYPSPDSVSPRAGTPKRLQSSSQRCPARDQLTAGILHTHAPAHTPPDTRTLARGERARRAPALPLTFPGFQQDRVGHDVFQLH